MIARGGSRCDGNQVSTNGMRSPASTVKSATVLQVLAAHVDRRSEGDRVRAGDRDPRVVLEPAHPGDDAAVVEADDELHPHRHAPLEPLDDPHDVGSRRRVAA